MADFYVTEERAMAPGVSGDWPTVIPKPGNPNGRLVKLPGAQQRIEGVVEEMERMTHLVSIPEQERRVIGDLVGVIRSTLLIR